MTNHLTSLECQWLLYWDSKRNGTSPVESKMRELHMAKAWLNRVIRMEGIKQGVGSTFRTVQAEADNTWQNQACFCHQVNPAVGILSELALGWGKGLCLEIRGWICLVKKIKQFCWQETDSNETCLKLKSSKFSHEACWPSHLEYVDMSTGREDVVGKKGLSYL